MYKIAIIGGKEILPFKVIGVDIYQTELDEIEIKKIIDKLVDDDYAVVFLMERYAKISEKVLYQYRNRIVPMITILPDNTNLNIGMKQISTNMEKAIGTNIF